jgi:hypothetical protein
MPKMSQNRQKFPPGMPALIQKSIAIIGLTQLAKIGGGKFIWPSAGTVLETGSGRSKLLIYKYFTDKPLFVKDLAGDIR